MRKRAPGRLTCVLRSNGHATLNFIALVTLMTGMANGAGTDGVMVVDKLTVPRGGVWLAKDATSGHWWQPDQVLGFCRVDPAPAATPPFQMTNCSATARSGGQALVAIPGAAVNGVPNARYVFVPDTSSKTAQVVRFVFDPATETLKGSVTMNVPNVTATGGGTPGGGRTTAVVLAPNGTDMYVAYSKSGDIMKVTGATTTSSGSPPITKIASTSDGRGVHSMVMFNNDLYIAELGGQGLTRIPNPAGLGGTPCNGSCNAVPVGGVSSFPGGIGTDGQYIYIAEAQPNGTPGFGVIRWNPATGQIVDTYSQNVPSYVSTFDNLSRSQYVGVLGVTVAPNGDVYVADDPFAVAVTPTTLQGHLWKVPAHISVSSVSPSSGPLLGGSVVTITGKGFATAPGATTVLFGSTQAANVNCSSSTTCIAISPAGNAGAVHVTVKTASDTSDLTPADQFTYENLSVTSIAPAVGPTTGSTKVTISGTGFSTAGNSTQVSFGPTPATNVACTSSTSCTAVSPAGNGTVDVLVKVGTQQSAAVPADQFQYQVAGGGPSITTITPATGINSGGTSVTITGTGLAADTFFNFGPNPATGVSCSNSGQSCSALAPAGGTGPVTVTATSAGQVSTGSVQFTYVKPTATLYAWGITAPKGGMVWIPGSLGGHFWSSDHSAGFCRHDPVPGATLRAMNSAVCDDGSIGSPGQAAYDTRINADGTHYVYVPDNAVKSTAVWRLKFNPSTETLVGAPEAMIPLADVRTLKPNGLAIGPDGNLYVTDLTELNIRKITGPAGDPRLQTVSIVAVTGDGRGANGTVGFIGNRLYISENRAAAWFDITQCPSAAGPCATTPIPLPAGAFIAGVATDPVNNMVYASDSPGGANATIWRHNLTTGNTAVYVQGGQVPAAGTPNATVYCSLTCTRPWDPALTPGGTAGFSFAFGIYVDPNNSSLYITEDPFAGARAGRGRAWVAPFVP